MGAKILCQMGNSPQLKAKIFENLFSEKIIKKFQQSGNKLRISYFLKNT